MKHPGFLALAIVATLATACGGGGAKKEAASTTTSTAAATTSTAAATSTTAVAATALAAESTTTTSGAAAASSGQALKDGFSLVPGTKLYKIEDLPDSTYGNVVNYGAWRATLDLTGDIVAAHEAFKAQATKNGYTLHPDDNSQSESNGHKYTYRSFTALKEIARAKAVGGKATTDQVTIQLVKDETGSGEVTINVEHHRYTD